MLPARTTAALCGSSRTLAEGNSHCSLPPPAHAQWLPKQNHGMYMPKAATSMGTNFQERLKSGLLSNFTKCFNSTLIKHQVGNMTPGETAGVACQVASGMASCVEKCSSMRRSKGDGVI